MTAQISIEEFRKRLKLNTKLGNPKISGTPLHAFNLFGEKDKRFYGNLNENDFTITTNAIFYPIPYILNGKIESNNTRTEIVYQIVPIKFGYYWIRYCPLVMLIVFNILFITDKLPVFVVILCNFFIITLAVIVNLTIQNKKRNFEKKFKEIFEII